MSTCKDCDDKDTEIIGLNKEITELLKRIDAIKGECYYP